MDTKKTLRKVKLFSRFMKYLKIEKKLAKIPKTTTGMIMNLSILTLKINTNKKAMIAKAKK